MNQRKFRILNDWHLTWRGMSFRSLTCVTEPLVSTRDNLCRPACFLANTFTTEYSMSAPNTNMSEVDCQMSMALMYETLGRRIVMPELWVVIVNTVKSPGKDSNFDIKCNHLDSKLHWVNISQCLFSQRLYMLLSHCWPTVGPMMHVIWVHGWSRF